LDWNIYVSLLLWRGIRSVIEDLTPANEEILRKTLIQMHQQNPKFVSRFIVETLKKGEEIERREETKRKLGFIW